MTIAQNLLAAWLSGFLATACVQLLGLRAMASRDPDRAETLDRQRWFRWTIVVVCVFWPLFWCLVIHHRPRRRP